MCGRYTLLTETYDLAQWFELETLPPLTSRYNIAPSYGSKSPPSIVRLNEQGAREMAPARWWLIPSWWKKPLKELPTAFNARSENIATSPLFRSAFRHRRCLVPASGWYEFKGTPGKKESYYFHMPDRAPFAFGGVWDRWMSPQGELIDSFSVITTQPNEFARAIHNRMPLVIARDDYSRWMSGPPDVQGGAKELCTPFAGALAVYRTRGFGNDPRHEGPDCIAPLPDAAANDPLAG